MIKLEAIDENDTVIMLACIFGNTYYNMIN